VSTATSAHDVKRARPSSLSARDGAKSASVCRAANDTAARDSLQPLASTYKGSPHPTTVPRVSASRLAVRTTCDALGSEPVER
jgi:hypothetical protein